MEDRDFRTYEFNLEKVPRGNLKEQQEFYEEIRFTKSWKEKSWQNSDNLVVF